MTDRLTEAELAKTKAEAPALTKAIERLTELAGRLENTDNLHQSVQLGEEAKAIRLLIAQARAPSVPAIIEPFIKAAQFVKGWPAEWPDDDYGGVDVKVLDDITVGQWRALAALPSKAPVKGEEETPVETLEFLRKLSSGYPAREQQDSAGVVIQQYRLKLVLDYIAALAHPSDNAPQDSGEGQEPKYRFDGGRVYNRASGEVIPLDEPVMVFRARDRHAVSVIEYYAALVGSGDADHVEAVHRRHEDFAEFVRNHPDRMKEPDTETLPPSPSSQGIG